MEEWSQTKTANHFNNMVSWESMQWCKSLELMMEVTEMHEIGVDEVLVGADEVRMDEI